MKERQQEGSRLEKMSEYAGYRIQINGKIFPDRMIARGSFNMTPAVKRIISEFYDADGSKHETYYPKTGVEISFKIKKRSYEEQMEIVKFFGDEKVYDLVYWDDASMSYKTGNFKCNNISYQHDRKVNGLPRYAETEVKFERL